MSRDFELLQRLEREWTRSAVPESIGPVIATAKVAEKPTIAQERSPAVTLPTANLAPVVRTELNKLVLRIFLSATPTRAVTFTGIEAEAGAKWIAGCTADILADKSEGRVCLVDADISSPTIHRLYSISNENGLSAVLAGSCSVGRATVRAAENLWIVPAGTQLGNAPVAAAAYQKTIADLQEIFDYLVICAPDCDKYAESDVIGAGTEGVVLVIDAATTRRAAARDAKAALEMAKARVLGSVFNNRTLPVPDLFYLGS
jgi:Mrp family chromosome partitioning ATPase